MVTIARDSSDHAFKVLVSDVDLVMTLQLLAAG
jgi:hypothetical protein